MKNLVQTLDVNTGGRDFVIGDLHGCFELLCNLLTFVDFDIYNDRLISVGDLVDRGPDSLQCLQLLDKPWFHCVKGNHEQLMEDFLTGGPTGAWWFHNGGNWWNDLDILGKDEVNRLLPKVQSLPWILTVALPDNKKFNVVHAELDVHPTEITTDNDLEAHFDQVARVEMGDGEAALWGRALWGNLYAQHLEARTVKKFRRGVELMYGKRIFNKNLSMIYSGHTTVRQPCIFEGQTNLDTGAFRASKDDWAGLTMTEPLTNRFWTAKRNGVLEVSPVIL